MGDKIRVCLVGANGRMGNVIHDLIIEDTVFGEVTTVDSNFERGRVDFTEIGLVEPGQIDVVINFTNPEATLETAKWCAQNEIPLATGTTGLSKAQLNELEELSDGAPILWAPNMSLGVNLIDAFLPRFAEILEGFAIEMIEIHHDKKRDYPSGTAIRFAQTLVKAKGGEVIFGRAKGASDNRPINEVVVHALRGGTVPGEHTIYFLGPDEVIEIKHRALSRKIFALGALKAAKWIIESERGSGFHTMNDVLGI